MAVKFHKTGVEAVEARGPHGPKDVLWETDDGWIVADQWDDRFWASGEYPFAIIWGIDW